MKWVVLGLVILIFGACTICNCPSHESRDNKVIMPDKGDEVDQVRDYH
jgi:hypothetical protein